MKIFEEMEKRGHEELIFSYSEGMDLKVIMTIHDSTLGKTIGGLRMANYSSDMEAVEESLKLSQSMTYQSATADKDCGGCNVMLLGNPQYDKSEAFFRALGRFVQGLKGRITIYPDLGTEIKDFEYIQRETDYTIFKNLEDYEKSQEKPSAKITASGVYWGIKACAKTVFGTSSLSGLTFSIQGLGNVGKEVVHYLKKEDTTLYVSDLIYDNIKEMEDEYTDIRIVKPDEILYKEVDFLVPCAAGSIITKDNIDEIHCKVIAGAAYNIFAEERLIEIIHNKGILYAPDFVISSGDLFLLDQKLKLSEITKAEEETKIIYTTLLALLNRAKMNNISPYQLAVEEAVRRYREIDHIKNILC